MNTENKSNQENEEYTCWDCKQVLDSFLYSPSVELKNGKVITLEELIYDEEIERVNGELTEEFGEDVSTINFSEFCPHCLNSVER